MTKERCAEIEKYILSQLEEIWYMCDDVFDESSHIHMMLSKERATVFALDFDSEYYILNADLKREAD